MQLSCSIFSYFKAKLLYLVIYAVLPLQNICVLHVLLAGFFFLLFSWSSCTILHVSCVCSRDKPINHRLLYFAHSKRHNFPTHSCLPPNTYTHTHTPPYGTFHCCCSHASQMKAILHSVDDARRMRDWHSFIMVKWRGEKEEALSGRRCHVTE